MLTPSPRARFGLASAAALALLGLSSEAEAQTKNRSWDYHFGAVPRGGLLTGQLGYPGMPRLEYHHGVADGFSIGGAFTTDLGYYVPDRGIDLGLTLGAPFRLRIAESRDVSAGFRFEPGIGFFFEPDFNFAVLARMGGSLGFRVGDMVVVGGGVDIPFAIAVDPFIFTVPILFGPLFEIHPTRKLAVTAALQFGPTVRVFSRRSAVDFGLKMQVGIAYRL